MRRPTLHIHRTGPNSARVLDLLGGGDLGAIEFQYAQPETDRPTALIDLVVHYGAVNPHRERVPASGFMTRLSEIFDDIALLGEAA